MASSQKKKTNTKAEPARNRRKAAQPQPSRIPQRIAGAVVCMLLALCIAVSYFGSDAVLLSMLATLLRGLFGYIGLQRFNLGGFFRHIRFQRADLPRAGGGVGLHRFQLVR